MTYGWAKSFALQLMNQYSMAGEPIPESYNNQDDDLRRIPGLIDDAQLLLATTEGRMRELRPLSEMEGERRGMWMVYPLPEDCWQMRAGLLRLDRPGREARYRLAGGRLEVWQEAAERLALEYDRLPRSVGENPSDDTELDNSVSVQQLIPWYVAAHLLMYDNAFAYAALLNEFEQRRVLLREMTRTEWGLVEDAYGGAWE